MWGERSLESVSFGNER
ncbi:tetratricopeptide repeat protein, possible pseudogene [Salmonella enterica subsp. enterica serovar Bovismorbificans str. 3114]|nr:tetratricopeptide repeat protein, possible pseudogene [Salmonella enterica subsp. enterica serovar Bovismorbificans str. 3114]